MNYYTSFFKRTFDLVFAVICFLLFIPSLAVLIGVKIVNGGQNIFFVQPRVGYKNKIFLIYKFATMVEGSHKTQSAFITTAHDYRITSIGAILRKTKIDELPQIINIFRNEMSVVGPRPLMKESFYSYPREIQNIIYNTKPGITGIGSLIFRDEERLMTICKEKGMDPLDYYKNHIYAFKGDLETWYLQNVGFKTDIKILILTFWVVFSRDNNLVQKAFSNLPKVPLLLTEDGLREHKLN